MIGVAVRPALPLCVRSMRVRAGVRVPQGLPHTRAPATDDRVPRSWLGEVHSSTLVHALACCYLYRTVKLVFRFEIAIYNLNQARARSVARFALRPTAGAERAPPPADGFGRLA